MAPPEEDSGGEGGVPLRGGRGHSRGALAPAAPDAFPPFVGRFILKEFQVGAQAPASLPLSFAKQCGFMIDLGNKAHTATLLRGSHRDECIGFVYGPRIFLVLATTIVVSPQF